ncbi:MAG: hypothetical protein M3N51_01485 [Actinomycetota bacterium]|nr:hypothetical protein [Actinomycetota bacterium]
MQGAGPVIVAALLFALLLGIAAALLWQETRRRSFHPAREYLLEEAVGFVHARLPEPTRSRLDDDDVRRILEWEVLYLQGRGPGGVRVAGGAEAVRYVRERAARVQGVEYREEDIDEVLRGEAGYLMAIGAVGGPVGEAQSALRPTR